MLTVVVAGVAVPGCHEVGWFSAPCWLIQYETLTADMSLWLLTLTNLCITTVGQSTQ